MDKYYFNKLRPFKWFILQNFPFIEEDFDAITNYQLFCKLGEEINKIINSQNDLGKEMETIVNQFITLQNYVDNYFDNLNVQNEINNKLDEMVIDGTLENILSNYIDNKVPRIYNTLTDLLNDNLLNNEKAITLGYNFINDGGGAEYYITDSIPNNSYYETLNNGKYAQIIIKNNTINIKQLGGVENNDISTAINKYLLYNNNKIVLLIPHGNYFCSEINISNWCDIRGESNFVGKTIIKPYLNSQNYIFKLNGIQNWNLEKLHFETGSNKYVNNAIIHLYNSSYGNLSNISYQNVIGSALYIEGSFEINFYNTIIRHCIPLYNGENYGAIIIKSSDGRIPSTLYWDYIQLERIEGNVFIIEENSALYNNHIGSINLEQFSTSTSQQDTILPTLIYNPITEEIPANLNHLALFKLLDNSAIGGLSIDSIDTNNCASCLYYYNGYNYIFDTLFYKSGAENTNKTINVSLNNLSFLGLKQDFQLLNVRNGQPNIVNNLNKININNILYNYTNGHIAYFNCKGENNINCCNINVDNTSIIPDNVIECCKITKKIQNNNFGYLTYDSDSLSSLKMVVYPFQTFNENAFFDIIATSKKLLLRYKANSTTNIVIKDNNNNNSHNFVVYSTSGQYVWTVFNLNEITDFEEGHVISIGTSAGFNPKFDLMKFI